MTNPSDIKIFHSGGEWSAMYIKGMIATYGDTYLIWEHLTRELGIEEVCSEDWLVGNQPCRTLDQVNDRRRNREARENKAASMVQEAEDLEKQAQKLRADARLYTETK